jgi:predicted nucleic acid-binding protein
MAPIVLLDACVLLPMIPCDILLEVAEAGLFEPRWSDAILAEVERNLIAKFGVPLPKAAKRINQMNTAFPLASVAGWQALETKMLNHPKDRHVLAAAVSAKADMIVTFNLRDFPPQALTPHAIDAVHPDAFLSELLAVDPQIVLTAVERKRASYRNPPVDLTDLTAWLATTLPGFAQAIQAKTLDS